MGFALVEADGLPVDDFVTVDGMRLHYFERGAGTPVVLLHGNGSMIGDFLSSGIVERIASRHRVIAFDRPGFGYSERPRDRRWGPSEQARLLLRAFARLAIDRPIVVGHSWGALVALALALEASDRVTGLVLLSGYYYPVPRTPSNAVAASVFPIVDDVWRQAILPLVGRLMASHAVRRVFAPCEVPENFKKHYSIPHALRPSQIKAVAEEADMLVEAASNFCELYKELAVPVRLIAGSDDRIVDTDQHSARLHRELGMSTFRNVPGIGHMVHHAAPDEVLAAIFALAEDRGERSPRQPVQRHWLSIGEDRDVPDADAEQQQGSPGGNPTRVKTWTESTRVGARSDSAAAYAG
jgi:pimeloyl-ACP methyl ester carboxylesterase